MIRILPRHAGSPIALLALLLALLPTGAFADTCPEDCSEPAPPPVNIYSHTTAGLSPATAGALPRVYVPNRSSNSVSVIDTATLKEVDRFPVGSKPQHVVPSWDLKTLWVANNGTGKNGSLTPIDPMTGKPGKQVPVDDPYNVYFMPDGSAAIIVDEALKQLDLRDPQTMALKSIIPTPTCPGINHADFSADNSYAIFTCEYGDGGLAKVDLKNQKVLGHLDLSKMGMPQDIRLSPDGKVFYVADMMNDGVFLIDGDSFKEIGFIPTGIGAHGFVVSRDGKRLYVSNRGSHKMEQGRADGPGSVTGIDFATRSVVAQWPIPEGGSPDMGNVSADGKQLWLSGRFDSEVYMIDTTSGAVTKIRVGVEPHGLTVWPQPGRYSQGHTGNMR
ncbi:YncE family protein [Mesorhizobium sp. M1C.F.Ca.ET.193.01.1.1]|uniref:YVTN family beta-propeller repeat protein n=1 Tax=unclassified Mesorhizobium TaxID=325217 RepID=UPI000FD400BD|nr:MULTISPECIES: YncE family protein [unclassified Mesorhizobium]TGT04855.1 YncE family protein [bacterium M00.F.Ca.ET.177.01.1.1]TGQ57683.1 YncE family protein [Mesorhizobium sp. M1C.F.Ca.ET.210.01.1.1]TGQ76139.1 YncE family protein [Mesorhizobium sp. M1C.F.Ca.ET.212.01.1.1]TGR14525.1 YncE family protein [Mesorhizobium sp. M1C.F.Ca.ET.204.01.1.1]TGR35688.1 YncE family protein [Mesorhizobium sp. M1C.F.Ca.ET.196.01.1.1]